MLKKLVLTAAIAVLGACSSGDDNNNSTTPPVTPPTGGGGTPGTPTGTTEGSWTGTNDFGSTYTIIDGTGAIYAFTDNGAGQFRSTFGNISGALEQFANRASDNEALGQAHTVVGDPAPAVTYSFTVSSDGRSITNSGSAGAFTLTQASVTSISVADAVGNWASRTAFCADCPLAVDITIAADGTLTGTNRFTFNGAETTTNWSGTVSGSGSFLGVVFDFDGQPRSGVLYRSPDGSGNLIMNTFGPKSATVNESFTADLSR